MKRIFAAAILMFLAVAHSRAAECRTRGEKELVPVPAGVTLQHGGYICFDHRGTYAEVSGEKPLEVSLLVRQAPGGDLVRSRVQVRPLERVGDLLDAGLVYPSLAEAHTNLRATN